MKRHPFLLSGVLLGVLAGCQTSSVLMTTDPRSPVRLHLAATEPLVVAKQILLLPPTGVTDPGVRHGFQQKLFRSAQRYFDAPVQMVTGDSAYAAYLSDSNLTHADGSFNLPEITGIGKLMKVTHVICPTIRDIRPYHPQQINLSITVIHVETGKITANLSGVFDASDPVVQKYFRNYRTKNKTKDSSPNDLRMEMRSPAMFQTFVSEVCCTLLADKLPL